jgi:hypothetical protein
MIFFAKVTRALQPSEGYMAFGAFRGSKQSVQVVLEVGGQLQHALHA